jgi:hypothetical protein
MTDGPSQSLIDPDAPVVVPAEDAEEVQVKRPEAQVTRPVEDQEGVTENVTANDLRRIADALEEHNKLKREEIDLRRAELTGEIQKRGYHGVRKDPAVWIKCSQEVVRLLEAKAFIDWEDVQELPTFRDPGTREDRSDGANMTREHQWKWFLKQHAIPRTPEYGAHLVAVGKEDKFGPSAVTLKGQEHCAKRAIDHIPDGYTTGDYGAPFDENCGRCVARKRAREDRDKAVRAQAAEAAGLTPEDYDDYKSWKRFQYGKDDTVEDYKSYLDRKKTVSRSLTDEERKKFEDERRSKYAEAQKKRLETLAAKKAALPSVGG